MSSLVQRQSERQGIFLIALSPFKRGAGGAKYQPYLSPPPENSSPSISSRPKDLENYLSYPLPKDLGRGLERVSFILK